jgi:hypothetical protein
MVLTRKDILKLTFFLYILVTLVIYLINPGNWQGVSFLAALKSLGQSFFYTSFLFGPPVILLGVIPALILKFKDKKLYNTAAYSTPQAALFIYQRAPDALAVKTTEEEIAQILDIKFELKESGIPDNQLIESIKKRMTGSLSENEIFKILDLEGEYMKEIGVGNFYLENNK